MRYFLKVSYNGTGFHGSQLQGDIRTVQFELNRALSVLLGRVTLSFGASRTDEGVHARANFYHFDTDSTLSSKFLYKLNAILPFEMAIEGLYKCVDANANARFDALSRRYRYRIYAHKDPFLYQRACFYPYTIDRVVLRQTADLLMDYTHFESFSKRNTQSKTFICTIHQSYWEEYGTELHYVVEANRFLRGMVRALVGTQLLVARGKVSLAEFKSIIESNDCTRADFSVPGHGLYLEDIKYPELCFEQLDMD